MPNADRVLGTSWTSRVSQLDIRAQVRVIVCSSYIEQMLNTL